jgi:Outer membrane cytochrome MtrC/MtrF-like, domains II/IV
MLPIKLNNIRIFILAAILLLLAPAASVFSQSDTLSDTENCLLCHRYPNMGRYDESGKKRVYYVNAQNYARSVHGKLKCKNCHIGLDRIPHTDVNKVDCATQCHIKEPSTDREFSHGNMIQKYEASVHGRGTPENPKPFPEDLPTCKDCHDNRMYHPFDGQWGLSAALFNETLARCMGCHTKEKWAQNYYAHFTHRMRKRRKPEEVVRLCTRCHEDRTKMARHGLESIATFKDTFHWTEMKFGVKNAPDCISCHVPLGYSAHDIRPRTDSISPINESNRVQTCSNQGGVQVCHPGAKAKFATGRVHAYGTKAQMLAGKVDRQFGDLDLERVLERAEVDISPEELFRFKVLQLIKLFYKIMIGGTIMFMGLHQWLDFLSAKRKQKKSP